MISTRGGGIERSSCVTIASSSIARKKLGQPQPESNLASETNNFLPQQTHWYVPASFVFQYAPVKARSVPFSRVMRYSSGVSKACHSASDF